MELQDQIGQALTTIQKLFIDENGKEKPQFRTYYVRLFRLAQLGLEFDALPDAARTALDRTIDDLIRAEGPRVKAQHLFRLGKAAFSVAAIFTVLYLFATFAILRDPLEFFGVDWENARSFMILWTGTAIGVWLSFAVRKQELKLRDLTIANDDFLEPTTRLVFTGLLANIIGLVLMLGIVDFELGSFSLSAFSKNPTIALFLGMLLGLNEAFLPDAVIKHTQNLWEKIA